MRRNVVSLIEVNLNQGSEDWHKFRANHIGASNAPIIMGDSPWTTPYQLWREKLGLEESKKPNAAMQRGLDLESLAREDFIKEVGIDVKPAVFKLEGTPFSCSLDGISDDMKTIVEIKCPGKFDHDLALNGEIPKHYWAQLQHQMYVIGVQLMYYFSYTDYGSAIVQVVRDNEYIDRMMAAELEFWSCVTNLEPPDLTERDFQDKSYDHNWQFWCAQWKEMQKEKAEIEAREELIRKKLMELSEGKNSRGSGLRLTQITRKGAIAYDKIDVLQNIDLEPYRKPPVTSWRFTAEK